jgi:hypothetical protein
LTFLVVQTQRKIELHEEQVSINRSGQKRIEDQ